MLAFPCHHIKKSRDELIRLGMSEQELTLIEIEVALDIDQEGQGTMELEYIAGSFV